MIHMETEIMSTWPLCDKLPNQVLHLFLIRDISGSYIYWIKSSVRLGTKSVCFTVTIITQVLFHDCSHLM